MRVSRGVFLGFLLIAILLVGQAERNILPVRLAAKTNSDGSNKAAKEHSQQGESVGRVKLLANLMKQARLSQKSPNVISGKRVQESVPEVIQATASKQGSNKATIYHNQQGEAVGRVKVLANLMKQARLAQKSPNVISGKRVQESLPEVMQTTAAEQIRIRQTMALQGKQSTISQIKIYIGDDEVIFNGITYPLVNGQVIIHGVLFVVCGFAVATESQHICCKDNIFPKIIGPISCCGDAFFYTDTESCCGEYFIPNFLAQGRLGCCNKKPFVVGQQFCCNNLLTSQPQCGVLNSCKAGLGKFCCGELVFRDNIGISCCKGKPYLDRAANCCSSGIVIGNSCDVDLTT